MKRRTYRLVDTTPWHMDRDLGEELKANDAIVGFVVNSHGPDMLAIVERTVCARSRISTRNRSGR